MGHNDAADHPGGDPPGGLVGIVELVVAAGEGNIKGPGKAIPEVVGGARLEGLPVVHHALHGIGLLGAVELFFVGLASLHHRHGQHIFHEVGIEVQHPLCLLPGLGLSGVHGVALLPQKFPVAEEGPGGLLPAEHRTPLVIELGQVPVGVDDVFIVFTKQGLRGGPDTIALLKLLAAAVSDPGALRGEALHMVLLLLKKALRDEHGEVDVLMARLLKLGVHDALDVLPQSIAIGAIDEHAFDAGIVDELRLLAHVRVPLGKVHLHVGDLLHLFFAGVLSHVVSVLYDQVSGLTAQGRNLPSGGNSEEGTPPGVQAKSRLGKTAKQNTSPLSGKAPLWMENCRSAAPPFLSDRGPLFQRWFLGSIVCGLPEKVKWREGFPPFPPWTDSGDK